MIFPKKSKIALKQKTYIKRYRRFGLKELLRGAEIPCEGEKDGVLLASKAKNCFFDDGLESSFFAKTLMFGGPSATPRINVHKIFSYGEPKNEKLALVDGMGQVLFYNEETMQFVGKCEWEILTPDIVSYYNENGYKCAAFIAADGVTVFDGENFVKTYDLPTKGRGCYAGERLFFLGEKDRVYYSAPLNVYELSNSADESGYLDLYSTDGEIVDVKDYGEDVFVFRKNGVGKITAKGAASDFRYEELPYTGGRILASSAIKGKDGVYFVAADGIYFCDGGRTKKMDANTPMEFRDTTEIVNGVFFEGRIYFAFHNWLEMGWRGFCFNPQTGVGCYTSYIEGLSVADGRLISHLDTWFKEIKIDAYSAKLGANVFHEDRYFTVEETDFGIRGEKTVESIYFAGTGYCVVTLSSGEAEYNKAFFLEGGKELVVRMKGEKFTLNIVPSNGTKIGLVELKIKGL